ncbi:helix-turn-helix domain-containing protein [Apilactobacillus micheneri]|uniref:helix-turn-helix domain-containing protein n=1 Tax=Apilactobacillus micheneri TaxID=1899430 RepID=UPI0011276AB2|nr:helix-turn-helix transcriptional regulator [Apilactobacillus micheneri]TPR38590.1 XRE family transcriptional regulator [Apilactobacillus micheneri]
MKNNLSMLMGAKRINICKLSENTGVSRNTISNIYNQKNVNTNLRTFLSICDYFLIPLHELIDYYPNEYK